MVGFWGIVAALTSILSTDEMLKNLYLAIAAIRSKYFEFFTTKRSKIIGAFLISLGLALLTLLSILVETSSTGHVTEPPL